MSIKMTQPMVTPPGANEQANAANLQVIGATTFVTREYREFSSFQDGRFFLDVAAASGTSPVMAVTVEEQDPVSLNWRTHTPVATVTGATMAAPVDADFRGTSYRAKFAVTGTTPSFLFTFAVVARSQIAVI